MKKALRNDYCSYACRNRVVAMIMEEFITAEMVGFSIFGARMDLAG